MAEPSVKSGTTPVDYGQRNAAPTGLRIAIGTALASGILLLWGLFELQRMPYRPPDDMRTLLGREEIAFVRFVMCVVAVSWLAGLLWFTGTWRRK